MYKLVFATVAVIGFGGVSLMPASAAPVAPILGYGHAQSAAPGVQVVDYYYHHRHWHHRSWDRHHQRWRYYD